jgi:hypothetical protein
MNLQRKLRLGPVVCILALTGWIGAPLQAQQAAPEPEAAAPATAFPEGPLPPHVAEQVRAIVMAQIKASLPPIEAGAVEIVRLSKDTLLTVTLDGQKYSAKVFRPFLAEPLNPDEFFGHDEDYYVRTLTPWKLKADLVIPADTYLSGKAERVSAYDADTIAAQEAAIARSDAFCKAALGQLDSARKDKAAAIAEAHKAEMDALTKQITQLKDDAAKKEAARNAVIKANIALTRPKAPVTDNTQTVVVRNDLAAPPAPGSPVTTKDANGKILWQWSPDRGFTFNDGLDQTWQAFNQAVAAQKTLQATMDAELIAARGQPGSKEKALRAIFKTHCSRILAGETISDEDMQADYESASGEPLKATPASGTPQPPGPTDGKPPIQTVPAKKPRA